MSLKDIGENKQELPLPRSIPQLRALMGEVRSAMSARRLGALQGLTEELHTMRRKVASEMIESGRVGAPSATIEAYSGIVSEALELYGQAQLIVSGLGTGRS